ncbi:MAG TPA: RNA polymerase sigma-70 factor [Pseudonocardiaceae bacterium]|nr:RNA polymerase sigma-70 factor [Pseudonocardiaceae bacterium]
MPSRRDSPAGCDSDAGHTEEAAEFVALRPLLFSLAYQMTGGVADAEDIVSEAYLRLRRAEANGTRIDSLKNYLSSVVTRLSIDQLRSARSRREAYVGTWLPEPLIESASTPEFERVELADTLSMAFLVLLETLTPTERAVFLLREVFEFDYPQISRMLDKSEPYCRQLLSRARQHVDARKPRFDANNGDRDQLTASFFTALEDGDLDPLITMLAADVVAYGDGGNGPSLPRPVDGRDKVLRLLTAVSRAAADHQLHFERVLVNGQPGALFVDGDGLLLNVIALDVVDGVIQTVRSIVNPDKLAHIGPLISEDHPLRGGGRRSARSRR